VVLTFSALKWLDIMVSPSPVDDFIIRVLVEEDGVLMDTLVIHVLSLMTLECFQLCLDHEALRVSC
jgi:cell division protein FtsW (lipid II flippase)